VFGRKDYQQFTLLRRMVRDLDFGVHMVGAPLLREADGLALSSRNVRLSAGQRADALAISAALRAAEAAAAGGERDAGALAAGVRARVEAAGGAVDYVEVVGRDDLRPLASLDQAPAVCLVAAKFGASLPLLRLLHLTPGAGSVRLLDNVELQ